MTTSLQRLPMAFGEPTRAAILRSMTINPETGLREPKRPAPRWIGHGQQLAAARLASAAKPLPPSTMTRQQRRHGPEPFDNLMDPSARGAQPRKSRGPTGFKFEKCDPARHLNSSPAKRQWRAKKGA